MLFGVSASLLVGVGDRLFLVALTKVTEKALILRHHPSPSQAIQLEQQDFSNGEQPGNRLGHPRHHRLQTRNYLIHVNYVQWVRCLVVLSQQLSIHCPVYSLQFLRQGC